LLSSGRRWIAGLIPEASQFKLCLYASFLQPFFSNAGLATPRHLQHMHIASGQASNGEFYFSIHHLFSALVSLFNILQFMQNQEKKHKSLAKVEAVLPFINQK
jgi:hypothetical protein